MSPIDRYDISFAMLSRAEKTVKLFRVDTCMLSPALEHATIVIQWERTQEG